jgi:hypothetical protein
MKHKLSSFNTRLIKLPALVMVGGLLAGALPGYGQGVFLARTFQAVNSAPANLAMGDVNGDGRTDVVVSNRSSSKVSVLLGQAAGTLGAKTDYTTGSMPGGVALQDINADGRLDIVVCNISSNTVSVLLGQAGGSFAAKVDYATGTNPVDLELVDVNGDGRRDIVLVNESDNNISVLLKQTTGNGFAARVNYATGTIPGGIALGDLNGDGDPDVVTIHYNSTTASVLLGQAGSSFSAKTDYTVGSGANDVKLVDVTGDGRLDMVLASYNSNAVLVLPGQAGGTFGAKVTYTMGSGCGNVAVGNVNGDSLLDLVSANQNNSTVSVRLGLATGGFSTATSYAMGSTALDVALGDINADGLLDIVTADYSANTVSLRLNSLMAAPTVTAGTRCGAGSVTLQAAGTPTGGSYRWYTVATGGTAISGATGSSYSTSTLYGTTTYYVSAVSGSNESSRTAVTATVQYAVAPAIVAAGPTTFNGGGSVTLTAQPNLALRFNGSSQYVATTLNASASTLPTTTWEAWVYPTRTNFGTRQTVFSVDDGGFDRGVIIEANTASFGVFTGTGLWTPVAADLNTWQHLAVVYTPTGVLFYKNGVEYSYSGSYAVTTTNNPLNIGRNPGFGEYFQGQLDEVRVWNTQRSQAQVQAQMFAAPAGNTAGLSSYWRFNEGSGSTATNETGSSTATLTSAPTYVTPGQTSMLTPTFAWSPAAGLSASTTASVVATPGTSTTYNVSVTDNNSCSTSAQQAVTVILTPDIAGFTPSSGPVGTTITISGINLSAATSVTFDGSGTSQAAIAHNTGSSLEVAVPAGATTGTLTVNTPAGPATSTQVFTVVPAPALAGLSATAGLIGSSLIITGTNLGGASSVSFNGTATTTITNASASSLTVTVPAGATSGNVVVTTPGGASNGLLFNVQQNLTVTGTIHIPGGFYHDINITGTGHATLDGDVEVVGDLTVQSGGSLTTGDAVVSGPGNFTLNPNATLTIGHADGIAASGNTGAIQLGGTRTFSPQATYHYNGTGAQQTGTGLPSQVRGLVITADTAGVSLTQPVQIAQVLSLQQGVFNLNGQGLTLLSGAAGTALVTGTGRTTGTTATVQRYIDPSLNPGLGYRHYSAPVTGSTVADLTTPTGFAPVVNAAYNTAAQPGRTTPYPTVFGYDQAHFAAANNITGFDKGWMSPAALSSALVVGKGYSVNLSAVHKVDFTGALNLGPLSLNLGRLASGAGVSVATAAQAGWHLVGNPYPAPLDWSAISPASRTGLDASMYVYESTSQYGGNYRSYVNGIGSSSPLIGSCQGFFVRVSDGQTSARLNLDLSSCVSDYNIQVPVRRGTADLRPQVQLRLSGSGLSDELFVYAEAGATAGVDAAFDAVKMPNPAGLNLSAVAGAQELAIQGLPGLTQTTVVPLTVRVPATGSYYFTAPQLSNLPATTQVYLSDALTGQQLNLRTLTATGYAFSLPAGQFVATGRFFLHLVPAGAALASASETLTAGLRLYPNPAKASTTLLLPAVAGASSATLTLSDALGRVLRTTKAALPATGLRHELSLAGMAPGVYVVKVQAGAATAVRRLTVE